MSGRGRWSMYRGTIHACIVGRYIDVSLKDTTCTEKRYNPLTNGFYMLKHK